MHIHDAGLVAVSLDTFEKMLPRPQVSEYHLDDSVDGGSTILDPADATRLSFDQETYTAGDGASEYGGGGAAESLAGTEYANRLDLGNLNLVSWKNGPSRRFLGPSPALGDTDDVSGSNEPRLKFHGERILLLTSLDYHC